MLQAISNGLGSAAGCASGGERPILRLIRLIKLSGTELKSALPIHRSDNEYFRRGTRAASCADRDVADCQGHPWTRSRCAARQPTPGKRLRRAQVVPDPKKVRLG